MPPEDIARTVQYVQSEFPLETDEHAFGMQFPIDGIMALHRSVEVAMTSEAIPLEPARDGADGLAPIAANTRRAYEAALRGFEGSDCPETDEGIAAYLTGLYEAGRSSAGAAMVVAALRFRARRHGRPSPVGAEASRVLGEFRRLAAERGRGKVAGVRWEEADRAAALAGETGTLAGLRDAAIVAVASDALLRVSEVEALDVKDVNLDEQTVSIRRGKSDQEGEDVVQYLGEPTAERIRAWLAGFRSHGGGALPGRLQGGPVALRAPDGQEHPAHHRPVGQGRGCARPCQRPQPARGRRAEPGERRRLPGRDAGRGALVFARHAGALRARGAEGSGRRGEASLRPGRPAARADSGINKKARERPPQGLRFFRFFP